MARRKALKGAERSWTRQRRMASWKKELLCGTASSVYLHVWMSGRMMPSWDESVVGEKAVAANTHCKQYAILYMRVCVCDGDQHHHSLEQHRVLQ